MSAMEANTAVTDDVLLDVQGLSVEYASPGTTPVSTTADATVRPCSDIWRLVAVSRGAANRARRFGG